jgi:hypothetical protein
MDPAERLSSPCAECGHATFHDVLHSIQRNEQGPLGPDGPSWQTPHRYRVLQCRACEAVSLMHNQDVGTSTEYTYLYPSPVSRKAPEWLVGIQLGVLGSKDDGLLADLLDEIYAAVRGGQHRLAAMGIRALFEQMMISKVGDKGSFAKNLDAFHAGGYISTPQHDAIKETLEVGHATMHRGFLPSELELKLMLDILEGVFAAIAIHTEHASTIGSRVPPRK